MEAVSPDGRWCVGGVIIIRNKEIERRCENIRMQLDWMKKNGRWSEYRKTLGSLRMLIRMSDDPAPYEALLREYE